jgi:hypothetical protein
MILAFVAETVLCAAAVAVLFVVSGREVRPGHHGPGCYALAAPRPGDCGCAGAAVKKEKRRLQRILGEDLVEEAA